LAGFHVQIYDVMIITSDLHTSTECWNCEAWR